MPRDKEKRSFFERLTGGIHLDDGDEDYDTDQPAKEKNTDWIEENNEEGQLTVDVLQTPDEIIIKTMVAGVRPDELSVSISRDMVTIKGRREEQHAAASDDYFYRELYWGSFSRTIALPCEIDTDGVEAVEKRGLLTLRLPKLDKERVQNIKIKSA